MSDDDSRIDRLRGIAVGELRVTIACGWPPRADALEALWETRKGSETVLLAAWPPTAALITHEWRLADPLRDEGKAYARKLKEAGVAVTATDYNGTIHDYVLLNSKDVPST